MSGLPSSAEDYGALADAEISDTSDEGASKILRLLRDDDPNLDELEVSDDSVYFDGVEYFPKDALGWGELGYYLGRSTKVEKLYILLFEDVNIDMIAPFFVGLQNNKSIQRLQLTGSHLPLDFSRMLAPFVRSNPNLTGFNVQWREANADQYCSLSSALREGKSLKHFGISGVVEDNDAGLVDGRYDHEESILANIEALKTHPHLERISFYRSTLGRNVCTALSGLLRQRAAGMHSLSLADSNIDDMGLEALVEGLACRGLKKLCLNKNPAITVRGWRALAALLEDPNSSLEELYLMGNGINDDSATILANALENNSTLETLYLHSQMERSGKESWKAYSTALCDTSSVNATFLSNHTLRALRGPNRIGIPSIGVRGHWVDHIVSLLNLNQDNNKKRVAIKKVLLHHDDFDMQPLFEWDLKALPFVIDWLERAAAYEIECEERTERRKLAAIYQFVRGMPELAIGGITGVKKPSANVGGEKRMHSVAFDAFEG